MAAFGGGPGGCPGCQPSNPGGVGQAGLQSAIALNNRPILFGSARRRAASIKAEARAGGWVRAKTVGALKQTEASEKEALRNRPMDRRAGVTSGGRERGEIDMGRQIGGAWRCERVGGATIADRLEAVAISAVLRAIVEEECGACMGGQARAQ